MKIDIDKILEEALLNVRSDRDLTQKMANDASEYIGSQPERHGQTGIVVAKYLETLQRSNEQLIKIAAILKDRKPTPEEEIKLEKKETEEFYEEFEGKASEK